MSMMDEYKALQKNKKKSILEEHIEKNGSDGLNEAYVQYATSPDRAEIDARNRAARTVSTPAAPSAETPKKTERRVMSPGGTFLGGFSFAGDRQKTAKELADEKAQQEAYLQEYRRLAGLDLDDYRAEVEQAGKKAQESKEPYNIHAFGAYNPQKTEAERNYAAKKADLNKAESIQYDSKGREALDNLTEDQTAALEVLTDTTGVPAAAAHVDAARKQAAREALLASGFTEDELSQLVNYYRNIPKREKNAERYAKVQEMARNEGEKSPIGGTLLSVPANLLSGVGAIDAALRKLADPNTPTDYNAPAMLPYAYASGVRGEVTKNLQYDHGDVAAFAYGVGTSMLDSAATVALAALGVPPAAASATLGGAAATDAMVAAKERGLDDDHAIVTGVAAGILESFFEKVSLESLISMKLPSGTMKQRIVGMLKNTAIQAGIEGSEEVFTDIGNLLTDKIINGDMTDVNQRIAVYMAGGMSYQEAQQKVVGETIKDMAVDFGAGALAGGLMGGGNMAVQTAAQGRYQDAMQQVRQQSGVTGAYQASEDGRTTYHDTDAQIRSVVKDGKVQLESGETVDPKDVRFKDQQTADLYEGAINTAENAGAAQDRAAQDAYGKSMAELEQCAALWQKAYDAAGKQAQKTKTAAREGDGEGRYQIKNIDGRLMTVIDTQNDTRDFKAAEAYLKTLVNTEHPFSTILMDAQPVFVGKDLPGEYKSSEYTKTMKPALRKIKMQAATNLDEMLLLAENGEWRENVKPKHAKDAQNGWYRYDTEFAVPVLDAKKTVDHYTVYGGTLLIRNDADGKSYLYDLLDVEKKKVISKTSFSAETHSEVTSPKPSTDSISTSGEKVNGKFSLKAYCKSQALNAHNFSLLVLSNFDKPTWPPSCPMVGSLRVFLFCSPCSAPLTSSPFDCPLCWFLPVTRSARSPAGTPGT